MMNKITISLCAFFLMMLALEGYGQTNSLTLLEVNSSNLRYKTNTDYKSGKTKNKSLHHANLIGLKLADEVKFNLHETSTKNLKFLKIKSFQSRKLFQTPHKESIMTTNRRLKYSSLWAFTCLNYLYADLVGIMDINLLSQYQTGVVNGVEITPAFLTAAAAYMQLPLANVFLPHVIKNDNTLRWVQIVCGSIATLVQGATLFVGEPAPYYVLFSAIEMGATAYITYDAIKWKTQKKSPTKPIGLY